MKTNFTHGVLFGFAIILCNLLCIGNANAQYKYLGTFTSEGVPNYLEKTGDVFTPSFLKSVKNSLPESYPVPKYHPDYINKGTETEIKLVKDADVWVSFIDEGAGYKNVLGFYTYDMNNPPKTAPAASNITIIFPNVSKIGFGGGLVAGDKVYLGRFKAGTGIAWFLIANGFNATNSTVVNGLWRLYSNPNFNPEADSSLKRHTIILKDTAEKAFALGFEDVKRDLVNCDHDFNDVIFKVQVTPFEAVKSDSIIIIAPPDTSVSGGGDGGLESKRGIAEKVAARNAQKIKNLRPDLSDYSHLPLFANKQKNNNIIPGPGGVKTISLDQFVPVALADGVTGYATSPTDLETITNAVNVVSVDFVQEAETKAVVLALETNERAYDHTKAICDRLKGASILRIDSVEYNGYKFNRFLLKQDDGALEYAVVFSASINSERNVFSLQTQWLPEQYAPDDKFYNFQVWSNNTYYTQQLVEDIINNLNNTYPVEQLNNSLRSPKAYFTRGTVNNGNITLNVLNNTNASSCAVRFIKTATEDAVPATSYLNYTIAPNAISAITVPIADAYDATLVLSVNDNIEDIVYLADGAWGLEYDHDRATINKFDIQSGDLSNVNAADYKVMRNIDLKGSTNYYVSAFKFLRGSAMPVDLSAFKTLRFNAKGNEVVEVALIKNGIKEFDNQYRKLITISPDQTEYILSLSEFTNTDKTAFKPDDLTSIFFTIQSKDGVSLQGFDLALSNLYFSKEENPLVTNLQSGKILVAPNPSNGLFKFCFQLNQSDNLTYNLLTLNGQTILSGKFTGTSGSNCINISKPGLRPGTYYLQLKGAATKMASTVVIQ